MRIAVGGIEHETCGFAAPSPTAEATTLISVARTLKYGDELRSLGDANTIVDTASTLSHDFRRLPYTRLGRRMYPVDPEVRWDR